MIHKVNVSNEDINSKLDELHSSGFNIVSIVFEQGMFTIAYVE